jgi:hypothetical protein
MIPDAIRKIQEFIGSYLTTDDISAAPVDSIVLSSRGDGTVDPIIRLSTHHLLRLNERRKNFLRRGGKKRHGELAELIRNALSDSMRDESSDKTTRPKNARIGIFDRRISLLMGSKTIGTIHSHHPFVLAPFSENDSCLEREEKIIQNMEDFARNFHDARNDESNSLHGRSLVASSDDSESAHERIAIRTIDPYGSLSCFAKKIKPNFRSEISIHAVAIEGGVVIFIGKPEEGLPAIALPVKNFS